MDRSNRTLIASFLWVAALFIGMNDIVGSNPLSDWLLPLVLVVIGIIIFYLPESWRSAAEAAEVEAGIGDTEARSDMLAASAQPHPAELEDAVENMASSRVTTLEEVDALSGPPTDSLKRNPTAEVPAVAVPMPVRKFTSETPAAPVSIAKAPAETHEEEIVGTESRSDALATVAEPSSEELEGSVENVSTENSSSLEDTGELYGSPTDSHPRNSRSTSEMPKVSVRPDDLTKIEGIGPKMSAALVAAGIDTFAKLAATSEDSLRAAITAAGMRFAPSLVTWAEQASYAAKGDWDGLKSFQSSLTAGRRGD